MLLIVSVWALLFTLFAYAIFFFAVIYLVEDDIQERRRHRERKN